jgi:hypothetical protein
VLVVERPVLWSVLVATHGPVTERPKAGQREPARQAAARQSVA